MNNETDIGIKFSNKITNEKKLEKYREELAKIYGLLKYMDKGKMLAIQGATEETTKALKEQNKAMDANSKDSQKMARNFNLAFNYTTVRTFTRALKNLVTTTGNMVKQSASYLENMNLLDVAFNNNTKEADKFVSKLTEMYGLDESWGYRTVGIFKQLANAMGISAEAGDKLATILTQLSIDTASLYNIETSDAVSIFSSALAGQTKPARRLGADITQSTLQQTLDTAGIKEYVANLSYAEKRLVIVASLLQQLQQANNDWGRTIESVANQTRIMNEQWNRLTRAVGNVFLPIVKQLLPYLNAILMVMTEIINSIAILVGYNEEDFDYFKGAAEDMTDFETGAEGANSAVKKLNNSLRSFDRLNNITTSAASSSALGAGNGISPDIMKLFNAEVDKYNSTLENVQMKATKIRDSIMEWLGFTKKINPLTEEISFEFDHITSGTVLGALVVGGSIYKGIKSIVSILGKFNIIKTAEKTSVAFTKLKSTVSGLLVGSAGLLVLNTTIKDISKNGANAANVLGTIGGSLASIGGFAYAGFQIGGGWGAAIGALVGGLGALVTAMLSYQKASDLMIEQAKKEKDAANEAMEAQKARKQAVQDEMDNSLALSEYHKKLVDELGTIVDANGKVKKGYEDRAEFILNELNKAYGTEYSLLDLQKKGYGKIKDNVYQLIEAEKSRIILNANQEIYEEALKKQAQAYHDLYKEIQEWNKSNERANVLTEKQAEMLSLAGTSAFKHYKYTSLLNGEVYEGAYAYAAILNDLDATTAAMDEQEKAIDTLRDVYNSYNEDIFFYENLSTAILTENKEEQQRIIDNYANKVKENNETITTSYKERFAKLEQDRRLDIENHKKYNKEWTDDDEEKYTKAKDDLLDYFVAHINTVKELTDDTVDVWGNLATESESKFVEKFNDLNDDLKQDVIDKMYDAGYKISDELQKGINEKNPTIKFNTDTSKIQTTFSKLFGEGSAFNKLSKALGLNLPTSGWTVNANGGLPPVGQIFVANEKGPELIGQIGGQSFVANQNQIVDFLHEELGNAKSSSPSVMNFYLDANHKLGTYTLEQLQDMAKSNGQPIRIGG